MKVKQFILAEFKSVAFTDQFNELSCSELVEFIEDDDVSVTDEDVVFEAVIDWVQHDLGNRKSFLEAILEHVRLPYCTSHHLRYMKDTCDLLTSKCLEYLQEAMSFQAASVTSSCRTVPRFNYRKKSCLLVVGGLKCTTNKRTDDMVECITCEYYEEKTNCWEALTNVPRSVNRLYSVCYLGRSLILTGGLKGGTTVDQCWLCDLATKKWEAMPPLISERHFHRSVPMGDCVYVVGGFDAGKNGLASVECLNVKQRQWSSMADMPVAVWAPMVAPHGNKVYVFGGLNAQANSVCCTQVFDTTRGK